MKIEINIVDLLESQLRFTDQNPEVGFTNAWIELQNLIKWNYLKLTEDQQNKILAEHKAKYPRR